MWPRRWCVLFCSSENLCAWFVCDIDVARCRMIIKHLSHSAQFSPSPSFWKWLDSDLLDHSLLPTRKQGSIWEESASHCGNDDSTYTIGKKCNKNLYKPPSSPTSPVYTEVLSSRCLLVAMPTICHCSIFKRRWTAACFLVCCWFLFVCLQWLFVGFSEVTTV